MGDGVGGGSVVNRIFHKRGKKKIVAEPMVTVVVVMVVMTTSEGAPLACDSLIVTNIFAMSQTYSQRQKCICDVANVEFWYRHFRRCICDAAQWNF